jgi:hypothetical protein
MSDPRMKALPPVSRAILDRLIDQHEQPDRRRVIRARLAQDAAYAACDRREAHAPLERLAAEGALRLRWRKWEEGNWLESVDLAPEGAAAVYAALGRMPRGDTEDALRVLLDSQTPRAGWPADFIAWARAQLDAHRSPAPLDPADVDTSRDVLKALDALALLEQPALERAFSARVFGDSKRFEALRGRVLSVLRRHDAGAAAFGGDDDGLLRAHFLARAPEYVPLSGPLTLETAGARVDLGVFAPSVALPADLLRGARIADCPARAVVTVENATSFAQLAAERPPDWLAVYTGGFASPAVIGLLRGILASAIGVGIYHWGDLDVGGLRILAHLRSQLGRVGCVGMDRQMLEAHRAQGRALSAAERGELAALRELPQLQDCADVIDAMLEHGLKLEQEAAPAGGLVLRQ